MQSFYDFITFFWDITFGPTLVLPPCLGRVSESFFKILVDIFTAIIIVANFKINSEET